MYGALGHSLSCTIGARPTMHKRMCDVVHNRIVGSAHACVDGSWLRGRVTDASDSFSHTMWLKQQGLSTPGSDLHFWHLATNYLRRSYILTLGARTDSAAVRFTACPCLTAPSQRSPVLSSRFSNTDGMHFIMLVALPVLSTGMKKLRDHDDYARVNLQTEGMPP